LIGTYHPSQQNTFTGKLTRPMLEGVLRRARELAGDADRARRGPLVS
jgi:uracil-DNA glycosylase